jgi:uncharacterized membrane protein
MLAVWRNTVSKRNVGKAEPFHEKVIGIIATLLFIAILAAAFWKYLLAAIAVAVVAYLAWEFLQWRWRNRKAI